MKKFIVSFEVLTKEYDLEELTSKIGIDYSESSFSKGFIYKNRSYDYTHWKLLSNSEEMASLEEHIKDIFGELSQTNIQKPGVLPKDSKFMLNIGVLYSTDLATCSINLPSLCLKLIKDYDLDINITCYPTSDI